MNKKINRLLIGIIIVGIILLIIIDNKPAKDKVKEDNNVENIITNSTENTINEIEYENKINEVEKEENIETKEKIELEDVDGSGTNYVFEYRGEEYKVIYTEDNWHIVDSYRIRDEYDIEEICKALIKTHKIHGSDMKSYRTAKDMAYEWEQHNLAYDLLPDTNEWKENVKSVDLDPKDQGKNLYEMYESRVNGNTN